jgi:anti-sigma B factor antagonist
MTPTIGQRFALSWAGVAVPGGNAAVRTAQLPHGTRVIPLPGEDAAPLAELSIHDRGDVAVVSLRGELDLLGASVPQAHLSDIRCRGWPRFVADLTGLALIHCACLRVLVRHCKEIRGRGGSFGLAGPQCAVLRILAVTGLLSWFEVHDTVEDAVTGTGTQRSATFLATPLAPARAVCR